MLKTVSKIKSQVRVILRMEIFHLIDYYSFTKGHHQRYGFKNNNFRRTAAKPNKQEKALNGICKRLVPDCILQVFYDYSRLRSNKSNVRVYSFFPRLQNDFTTSIDHNVREFSFLKSSDVEFAAFILSPGLVVGDRTAGFGIIQREHAFSRQKFIQRYLTQANEVEFSTSSMINQCQTQIIRFTFKFYTFQTPIVVTENKTYIYTI